MSIRTGALIPDRPLRAEPRDDLQPLLATKLIPPRRGRNILPRPRLETLYTQVAERRLTVIEAPAGYGKSTLATIWADDLAARGHAVGWLSLDEDDNDPAQLQLYLFGAVGQALDAGVADACGLRSNSMIELINTLNQAARPFVLFIDDCQRVEERLLVGALRKFLQRAPESTHLVLCSRRTIPAELKESLYLDDLLELGRDELRFDLDETRDMSRKTGVEGAVQLAELHRCSEGWVAGLRAAIQTAPAGSGPLCAATVRCIRHVFEDAVQCLPAGQKRAILPLGLLDKFNDQLLRSVLGEHAAHGLIDTMLENGLFIQPLDESCAWYCLHPMFREYLRGRYALRSGNDASRFMLTAANWFADHQRWLDAIRLGMEAGELALVREWIAGCAMELVEQGDFAALVALEKRWQTHSDDAPLPLKLAKAWALGVALEADAAREMIAEITADLARAEGGHDWIAWELRAIEAMLLGLADRNQCSGPLAQHCYESSSPRPWVRNVLLNLICCSHFHAGRWDAFYTVPPTLCGPGMPAGLLFHDCYRQSLHALAEIAQGRVANAIGMLDEFLQRVAGRFADMPDRPNPGLVALPRAVIAQSHYLLGDRSAAQACLAQATDLVDMAGFLDCTAAAYCVSARLAWHQGQTLRSRRLLEQLEALANLHDWDRLRSRVLMERTRINLLEGKHREALACVHGLSDLAGVHAADDNLEIAFNAALAAAWLACHEAGGNTPAADSVRLLDQLGASGLRLWHSELALALGLQLTFGADPEPGTAYLDAALASIEESGAVGIVIDFPLPDAGLASDSARRDAAWQRIARLRGLSDEQNQECEEQSAALLGLTVKERQVMQLVAEGKSNKQVARDLNVAPETIKSHMKSIFAKLKVENRAQAAVMLRNSL